MGMGWLCDDDGVVIGVNMEQTDSNTGLSRFVCVDHFWKWLCNNVAEVSNQSPSSDQWSEAFTNYGLNNVLYYHWCVL